MTAYVFQRLALGVVVLFGIATGTFFLARLIPGDTVEIMLGFEATSARAEELRRYFGLDRPILQQYFEWLGRALQGDLGQSIVSRRPVIRDLAIRFPATLQLSLASMVVAAAIALPLGILAGVYPRTWIDSLSTLVSVLGLAVPHFWMATLLILFLAVQQRMFPVAGYTSFLDDPLQNLRHIVLPAITLGFTSCPVIMRQMRSSLVEVMAAPYIVAARAKGVTQSRVIVRHALRNAFIPVLTVMGVQAGRLLGGVIIIEQIFSWPGVGTLAMYAISQRDYPVLQGVVLLVATCFVVINLLVDLAYALIDPRIRYA
jgi:peptide/nickel transport system permease protein